MRVILSLFGISYRDWTFEWNRCVFEPIGDMKWLDVWCHWSIFDVFIESVENELDKLKNVVLMIGVWFYDL